MNTKYVCGNIRTWTRSTPGGNRIKDVWKSAEHFVFCLKDDVSSNQPDAVQFMLKASLRAGARGGFLSLPSFFTPSRLVVSVIAPNLFLLRFSAPDAQDLADFRTASVLFFVKRGTKLSWSCIYFKYNKVSSFRVWTCDSVAYFIAYTVTNIKASSTDS